MAPPRPPCRVDMRRTASRAQRNEPTTLVARIRVMPRGVHRLDAHLRLEDAGVVDQRRHRAERPVAGLEQPDDVGLDADVALHGDGAAAGRDDGGDDGIGRVRRGR